MRPSPQTAKLFPFRRLRGWRSFWSFKRSTSLLTASPTERRELAERVAVTELGARLAELTARVGEAEEQREKLVSQQLTLDQRSESVGGRIATIEQRLRSGRAGSYRDEQAMGDEVASLTHLRREIEDQELEIMEALEPLDQELTGLKESSSSVAEELALAREQLALATAEIDDEAAMVRAARDQLAERVAPELTASYERLTGQARWYWSRTCRGWSVQWLPPAVTGGGAAQAAPGYAGLRRALRPVWTDTCND